jgi:hypothetical protein
LIIEMTALTSDQQLQAIIGFGAALIGAVIGAHRSCPTPQQRRQL